MLKRLHQINGLLTSLDVAMVEADKASIIGKADKIKRAAEITREILAELLAAVGHLTEENAAIRREMRGDK
jgi:hypothetical protein